MKPKYNSNKKKIRHQVLKNSNRIHFIVIRKMKKKTLKNLRRKIMWINKILMIRLQINKSKIVNKRLFMQKKMHSSLKLMLDLNQQKAN